MMWIIIAWIIRILLIIGFFWILILIYDALKEISNTLKKLEKKTKNEN